jgi:hypothetical protein
MTKGEIFLVLEGLKGHVDYEHNKDNDDSFVKHHVGRVASTFMTAI